MPGTSPVIEWAVRNRPIAGERECGDLHVAAPFAGGALVGVIDGLGHGPEAAVAARAAAAVLQDDPRRSVVALVEACHEALRRTRGAVLTLISIDVSRDEMSWIGVGNVEAVLCRDGPGAKPVRDRVVSRSGVVGYQLPTLRSTTRSIVPGDVLVLASDGIAYDFVDAPPFGRTIEAHAAHVLDTYGKSGDDALVLVVRYLGRDHG